MNLLIASLLAAASGPSHHGFFLRMDLDAGYHYASAGSTTIDGPGGGFGISIGGNVADNLALFGTLSGSGNASEDTRATHVLFGVGLTYYLMPANVFLSGAVGFGGLQITQNRIDHDTEAGFAARVGIGKEWFVSDSWGLGIAAYFDFCTAQDKGPNPPTWWSFAPLAAFTATFY
ncbi:MAG TPA: hypothetical protein VG496_01960 [Myxococcales bacterium]|nr:hypothetical protein [Myxococcales bacterium]